MPYDPFKKQQKEFAYVDFETEAHAQEALQNHEEVRAVLIRSDTCRLTIRKSEIQLS